MNYKPCVIDHCGELWGDEHHIKQRSEGGSDREANKVYLCRRHHQWVHEHITYAHDLGLIVFGYEDEHKKPIKSVRIRPVKDKPLRVKDKAVEDELSKILLSQSEDRPSLRV
jgi:hypothetical protein